MNKNIDELSWESYDSFYKKIENSNNGSVDVFKEGLECFSSYLCYVSQNYAYNATYLPQFVDQFLIFVEAFSKKYAIARELFDIAENYPDITLKIDRYWKLETDENKKSKKTTLRCSDFITKKTLTIECSALCDMQRYIYHKNYQMKDLKKTEVKAEFIDFLQNYCLHTSQEIEK